MALPLLINLIPWLPKPVALQMHPLSLWAGGCHFLRKQYGVICEITRASDKGLCSWPDLLSYALLVPQRTGNGLREVLGVQLKLVVFPPFPRQRLTIKQTRRLSGRKWKVGPKRAEIRCWPERSKTGNLFIPIPEPMGKCLFLLSPALSPKAAL